MSPEQQHAFEQLRRSQQMWSQQMNAYWHSYSHAGTWHFWVCLLLLVLPLILLVSTLDRKHALQLGFFGLNVHVWFLYSDALGTLHGVWAYPYKLMPFMPNNLVLDASIVPVLAMLVYQWTLRRRRNPIFYLVLLGAVLAYGMKPLLSLGRLFLLFEWGTFTHLFVFYSLIFGFSLAITQLFLYAQHRYRSET